jgi:hypothetical protein
MTVIELAERPVENHLGAAAAKWIAIGLSTAQADRDAAAEAVRTAYVSAGVPPPARVVWFDSPLAGARAAALLTGRRGLPGETSTTAGDIAEALHAQRCPPTPGSAGVAVRATIATAPWTAARDQVHAALGPDAWARLWSACGAGVWRTITDRLATPLRAHLRRWFSREPAGGVLVDAVGGQHDAGWLAMFDVAEPSTFASAAGPAVMRAAQRLAGLGGVARSAGWWWPYARVAILTERPVAVHRDNLGWLHAADGPALRYRDDFAFHAWHGAPIAPELIDRLAGVTRIRVANEPDSALRRVMLEHYGYGRYVREAGAQRLAVDECGMLWRLPFGDDEPVVLVEVVDGAGEPGAAGRTHWLRVPPQTRTPREGIAWTFGLAAEQYAPLVET